MKLASGFLVISLTLVGIFLKDKPFSSHRLPVENNFAMVQLFTSQGCSSCPKADKLLEKIEKKYNRNVVLLAYHVTYWNRLGWKDPFSQEAFTNLQYKYEKKFNYGSVYTPEAVVNGNSHFVGSNKTKMEEQIASSLATNPENHVLLSKVEKSSVSVNFKYNIQGSLNRKNLKIALAIQHRKTKVQRGENGGRILSNSNIVINQTTIPLHSKYGKASINIPEIVEKSDKLLLVSYIQKEDLSITGAVSYSLN